MYIKGVGMTKFDYSQNPWWYFATTAAFEALEDAKMGISQIEAIVLTTISSAEGFSEHQTHKVSLWLICLKPTFRSLKLPRFALAAA